MPRLFLLFFTLSLPTLSSAEINSLTNRWIAAFHPDQVTSCDAESLLKKMDTLSSKAQLTLIRPYNPCGIIFLSDSPLDIENLKNSPSIQFIEPDGFNQIQPVMPPIK
ncbi:hypothetical protein [Endozoicomonas numazuensis]|uniref:Inhibitor I9 domain-containing protein n=1 Tax=Endozoicomonas numazuensis TaxID=1137799 RepID=A0A081N6J8_9GAMM|nr:hypothetical protein [Endozoicomonas numazuensis]KEQ14071.1 hypothetical protein GZ78_25915 [Endozoicomonas numazuensis]